MENKMTRYNGGFLDPFFDALFGDETESEDYGVLNMKTDITEEGENYVIAIEMPGMDKKNISLSLKDKYLTVKAQVNRGEDLKNKHGNFLHRERFSGVATRSYYVGEVEEKEIKASYKDGVLESVFPKESVKKVQQTSTIAIE